MSPAPTPQRSSTKNHWRKMSRAKCRRKTCRRRWANSRHSPPRRTTKQTISKRNAHHTWRHCRRNVAGSWSLICPPLVPCSSQARLVAKFTSSALHIFRKKARFVFFKKVPSSASFPFYFVFSNKHYNSYNKYFLKFFITIKYTVPGFKPTTFGTRVSSHNH